MSALSVVPKPVQVLEVASDPVVTIITSTKPQTLTKTYTLQDGELVSTTVANMYEGSAQAVTVKNAAQFAEVLQSLHHNQALCFGRHSRDSIPLLSKKAFIEQGEPVGSTTRTKESFSWPAGGGVMMLDYDPIKGGDALSREQWFECLTDAMPVISETDRTWWPSSSSNILNGSEEMRGVSGQRLWLMVKEAKDIPRAGKVLAQRLWLAGHGYFEVGAAGQLLKRTVIDTSVWQTNRLDFAAGANCIAPLTQHRGDPAVYAGVVLDTKKALPDLTDSELAQLATAEHNARAEVSDEADDAKALYIEHRALEISGGIESKHIEAKHTIERALSNNVLAAEFPIILESGIMVTVAEILDDPAKYHGALTLDPIEPEYENRKVVGKLYVIGSRPNLNSFAHGGRHFRLIRTPREIEVIGGGTYSVVVETLRLMRELPDVFDMGGQLVVVDNGAAHPMERHSFTFWLGGVAQFWRWKMDNNGVAHKVLEDPPVKVVEQILALGERRELKVLDAVITAPTMRPDGTILNKIGYDSRTRLLLDMDSTPLTVPEEPSAEQVRDALKVVMHPFASFPFESELDKGIVLASILTAVVRPVLDTAPAFGFDAPVQGSGKTLLARALGVLATGGEPTVWPHTGAGNDDEIRKRLLTALKGGARTLVWDNVLGFFDSASVAALLTSPTFTDRVLGASQQLTVPNRALFLITGNNLTPAGDMPRRVMKCRIDPKTDTPFARSFDLEPVQYVTAHRQHMVVAALTIIKGFMADVFATRATGRMASFELWDDMVRQPVAWIHNDIEAGSYGDPMEAVMMAQASDPEQDSLSNLLNEIFAIFGNVPFTAQMLITRAGRDGIGFDKSPLHEALMDVASNKDFTSRSISRVLAFRTGRIVSGMRLVKDKNIGRVQGYKVEQITANN